MWSRHGKDSQSDESRSAKALDTNKLGEFPAPRHSAGDGEEHDGGPHKHQNLRPEVGNRLVSPEDFGESVNRPGVNRQQPCLLHRVRHQEAREHAAANGGHNQNDQR